MKLTWALVTTLFFNRMAAHFPGISLATAHHSGVSASQVVGIIIWKEGAWQGLGQTLYSRGSSSENYGGGC